jgi:hypothetical protein
MSRRGRELEKWWREQVQGGVKNEWMKTAERGRGVGVWGHVLLWKGGGRRTVRPEIRIGGAARAR